MIDILTILGMTAGVSLVSALLLLIKALFQDKLNARWHYLIWIVLLVRLLVPIEQKIFYTPISLFQSIPLPQLLYGVRNIVADRPEVNAYLNYGTQIYLIGVGVLLLYFTVAYIHLWTRVKKGTSASSKMWVCVQEIAEHYHVPVCKDIRVCRFTETPFIIGCFRPTLVLPEEQNWNDQEMEAMILHELLHMKYLDVFVNFIIHAVRILNWFNPFMWYVLARTQNDNEALCDQRVLERMESDQRKEYGRLLVRMTNHASPPGIGTTSMANGASNIRIRLKRIADFGRITRENTLVSLCITLILSMACIGAATPSRVFETNGMKRDEVRMRAQFYEVSTPQEALNIYMKALELQNEGYMALVLPDEEWESGRVFPNDLMYECDYLIEVQEFTKQTDMQYQARIGLNKTIHLEGAEDYQILLHIYEDHGWKVQLLDMNVAEDHNTRNPHMLTPVMTFTQENERYQIKMDFSNENVFENVGISGWNRFGLGAAEEGFLTDFDQVNDWTLLQVRYKGEEDLTGRYMTVWHGPLECADDLEPITWRGSAAGGSSTGTSWITTLITEDWDKTVSDSNGNGEGPWDIDEKVSYVVKIYLDGILDAEFVCEAGGKI